MTCREADDFLAGYFDGTLTPEIRAAFERHLEACANCRAYLATYAATVRMTRRASAEDPPAMPDDLIEAIVASLLR